MRAPRNCSGPKRLPASSPTTQVGDLELQITKFRAGNVLPSILEARRYADQALGAVMMEAYIDGLPSRKFLSMNSLFSAPPSNSHQKGSGADLACGNPAGLPDVC